MPSTTGNRSRAWPRRRATISARDGSPSRAGSVADIRTPIVVPCTASTKRGSASGSAARRIACQETARSSIEAHISPSATSTHVGVAASSAWPIGRMPIRSSASSAAPPAPSAPTASAARRAIVKARACSAGGAGSSVGSRTAGLRGAPSAGSAPSRTAARRTVPSGAGTARASS